MRSLEDLITQQENALLSQRFNRLQNPPDIPILLAGGVGDVIMAIPVVEAIAEYGPASIYTSHHATFNHFAPPRLPRALPLPVPPYTWFIDVNALVRFKTLDRFSGVPGHVKPLWERITAVYDRSHRLKAIAHHHPLHDTALARFARELGTDRRGIPFFTMGMEPRPLRPMPRAQPSKYITIHDGYEAESAFIVPGRATKTWKWHHWNELVKCIHQELPDYKVIQLGTSTAREIEGVDQCLINKTTLPQAFEILAHSSLHIDGDSGLAHAATAMSVPCVVMFGPTPDYFFGYPQNVNLRSQVCADGCYWLTRDWLGKCPIGYKTPVCMDEIPPAKVLASVLSILQKEKGPEEERIPPSPSTLAVSETLGA